MNRPRPSVLAAFALVALLLPACSGNRELARRAHEGDATAQFEYGRRLLSGKHRLFASPKQATEWFRLAALQGHSGSQAALGVCYEAGLGVPQSLNDARHWYSLAAEQGNPMAALHLAMVEYREAKDPKLALAMLEQAADSGYIPARMRYALVLLKKKNCSRQDMRKAIDQLRIAGMDGCGEAAYLMGIFYASGTGVPQHNGIAVGWLEISAHAGYEPAKELLDDLTQGN